MLSPDMTHRRQGTLISQLDSNDCCIQSLDVIDDNFMSGGGLKMFQLFFGEDGFARRHEKRHGGSRETIQARRIRVAAARLSMGAYHYWLLALRQSR